MTVRILCVRKVDCNVGTHHPVQFEKHRCVAPNSISIPVKISTPARAIQLTTAMDRQPPRPSCLLHIPLRMKTKYKQHSLR